MVCGHTFSVLIYFARRIRAADGDVMKLTKAVKLLNGNFEFKVIGEPQPEKMYYREVSLADAEPQETFAECDMLQNGSKDVSYVCGKRADMNYKVFEVASDKEDESSYVLLDVPDEEMISELKVKIRKNMFSNACRIRFKVPKGCMVGNINGRHVTYMGIPFYGNILENVYVIHTSVDSIHDLQFDRYLKAAFRNFST